MVRCGHGHARNWRSARSYRWSAGAWYGASKLNKPRGQQTNKRRKWEAANPREKGTSNSSCCIELHAASRSSQWKACARRVNLGIVVLRLKALSRPLRLPGLTLLARPSCHRFDRAFFERPTWARISDMSCVDLPQPRTSLPWACPAALAAPAGNLPNVFF